MAKRKTPQAKPQEPAKPKSWLTRLRTLLEGLGKPKPEPKRWEIPKPWPGVLPDSYTGQTLAMDSGIQAMTKFAMDNAMSGFGTMAFSYGGWEQGGFLGYAFLAELSQITEYRRPAEILANECTRKWGKLNSSSDDEGMKNKLKELTDDLEKFNVQGVVNKAFELDNFFGVGHVFIDVGASADDLKHMLLLDPSKIAKDSLKAFRTVEPMWTYPNMYNSSDPLAENFYNPVSWFVMGKEVHKSRLMRFISRPMPDMLKPAYLFGGVALTQLLQAYVNNWLRTRQSVSDITHNFSTPVLQTDMDQMTTTQGAQMLALRAQIFNAVRDNQGLMVCDKDKEDFKIENASLGSLDALQAQAIEQMAFPSGIPLVKLLGVTPSGLNASSDGEIRVFYDTIASIQERIGTPHMRTIIDVLQVNRYGTIDPGITWEWAQLWELDEEKLANRRKTEAEVDIIYVEGGILDPEAVLERLNKDPEGMYTGLDLELPEEIPGEESEEPLDEATLMGSMSARTVVKSEEKADKTPREERRNPNEAQPARRAETAEERGARESRERSEGRGGRGTGG